MEVAFGMRGRSLGYLRPCARRNFRGSFRTALICLSVECQQRHHQKQYGDSKEELQPPTIRCLPTSSSSSVRILS
jgi:hypothetical protein